MHSSPDSLSAVLALAVDDQSDPAAGPREAKDRLRKLLDHIAVELAREYVARMEAAAGSELTSPASGQGTKREEGSSE